MIEEIKGIDEIPIFSWNTEKKEFYVLGQKFDGVNSIEDFINYITNLQQELQKANDTIEKDRQFYKCRMDEYVELKKENEKEKQFIKDCGFQNQQQLVLAYLDYKSRTDKAIEYIENNQERKTYYGGICDGEDYCILYNSDEVLNILNGVDEQ